MPTGVYARNGKAKHVPPPPVQGGHRAVSFRIVANPLPEDAYERPQRKKKGSVYQQALTDLAAAKRGSVLCFDEARCLPQLKTSAKKLGYTILVAERELNLYVQIVDTGDDK